jgi:hypothetical protein
VNRIIIYRGIQITVLIIALLFSTQLPSLAISVNGNLTSVAWARENRVKNADDSQTNLLLYEYLNLRATDLGSPKLAAYVSGRAGWDKLESFEEKETLRLYQGYLDWKLSNKSSLRLGRQFLPNDVGFWQIDGIRMETFRSGFISPAVYAGLSVLPWTINGDKEPLFGVELGTQRVYGIRSKVSFLTILDKDGEDQGNLGIRGVDKAILGVQIEKFGEGILDLLESPHNRLNIYGRGSIDLLSKKIVSSYVFANARIIPEVQVFIGYQHETPLFPADSIFSVFDSEPFRELNIGVDYQAFNFLSLQSQYARQFFDSEPINRYSVGFNLTNQLEPVLSLRLERLDDIDSNYWRIYSHIGKQLGQRLQVGLSNYYNNYKLSSSRHTEDAYSFQLKAGYQLTHNLQVLLRLEDNINPDYKYNIRALGYLRVGFGLGK